MNEIKIYRKITDKFKKQRKKSKYIWLIFLVLTIYSVIMISLPLIKWVTLISVLVPLIGVLIYIFLIVKGEYILVKKYHLLYKYDDNFVNKIESLSRYRPQPYPNHIKIQNEGLQHIDNIVNTYYDDKFKLSNGLYNAIQNTNLLGEINFYEKYKRFVKDMDVYRNLL